MKRTLVAAAIMTGFAGLASAQSSVTIYGVLDVGVLKTNGGTAQLNLANAVQTSKSFQQTYSWSSRVGFRGNEDLGGGLSAQFHMEHRFNADGGVAQSTTQFWNARSYVQLSSTTAGQIYLGRDYTPTFLVFSRVDPFLSGGVAQIYQYQYAGYLNPDTVASDTPGNVRTANTVGYKSPVIGGFSAVGAVALSEATQRGRDVSVVAQYSGGPLYAAVSMEKVYGGVAPFTAKGTGLLMGAFIYDFGPAKLHGSWTRSTTATPTANPLGGVGTIPLLGVGVDHNYGVMIGSTANIGPGQLKVVVARVDPRRADNSRTKFGLGYDYNLSKRTIIYTDGAYAKEDHRTNAATLMIGIRHFY